MRQAASSILSILGLYILLAVCLVLVLIVLGLAMALSTVLGVVLGIVCVFVACFIYIRATPWLFHIVMGEGVFGGYRRAMDSTRGLFWSILLGLILLVLALTVMVLVGLFVAGLLGPLGALVALVVQSAAGTVALLYSHQVYLLDADTQAV